MIDAVSVPAPRAGEAMTRIESEVLATFIAELAQAETVPALVTEKLGALLAADKLPKADELAALYAGASGEALL